jgi:hypothetical protein
MYTFVKRENAPDGIHDRIEFNEYRNAKWWTAKMHRQWLLDKVAPYIIVLGAIASFFIMGVLERGL